MLPGQVFPADGTKERLLFPVGRDLIGENPLSQALSHDAAFPLADIIVFSPVQIDQPVRAGQQLCGIYNILIQLSLGETQLSHQLSTVQFVPGRIAEGKGVIFCDELLQRLAALQHHRLRGGAVNRLFQIDLPVAADRDGRVKIPDTGVKISVHAGVHPVVSVHEGDQASGRKLNTRVSCIRQASVFLVKHPDSGILLRQSVTECPASVRGTVVHQQDLQPPVGLGHEGTHAPLHIGFNIIDRNHHGDQFLRRRLHGRRLIAFYNSHIPLLSERNVVPLFSGRRAAPSFCRKS